MSGAKQKSPAFQFYAAEFLADENVVLMTNQEVGCYIKLMAYCWREGSIPSEVSKIARLCGEDGSAMAQLWLAISPCFAQAITDNSRLVHPRLEIERKKQEEHRKERVESGKRGASKRWGAKTEQSDSESHSLANGSAIQELIAGDGSSSSSSSSSSFEESSNEDMSPAGADDEPGDDGDEDQNSKTPPCPVSKIVTLYHQTLPELARCAMLTPKREKQIRARWRSAEKFQSLAWWEKFFNYVRLSKFLMGDNPRGWSADIEFLTSQSKFVAVLEGKYHQQGDTA